MKLKSHPKCDITASAFCWIQAEWRTKRWYKPI